MSNNRILTTSMLGSIGAFNIAMLPWWAQPLTMDGFMRGVSLDESQSGSLIAIELFLVCIASLIMSLKVSKLPLRSVSVFSAIVVMISNGLSMQYDGTALIALRAVAGIFEGVLMACATAAIASSRDPDKAYGVQNIGNILFCSAFLAVAPFLENLVGPRSVFLAFSLASLLLLPIIFGLPTKIDVAVANVKFENKASGALVLLVMLVWGTTVAIPWFFLVDIGSRTALSIHQVGLIAGCSGLGGLIGGALATRLGRSVNRHLILAGGLVILSATTFVLVYWVNSVAFIISVFLFIACLYTLFPYLFGLAADLDPKGGLPAAMGAVYVLTGSTGAFLGGHAVHEFGLESMAWLVAVGAVICYPLLLIVLRQREKQLTPQNAELATH